MKLGIELRERYNDMYQSACTYRKYRLPPVKQFDEYKDPSKYGIRDVIGFLTDNTWLEITEVDDRLRVTIYLKLHYGTTVNVVKHLRQIEGYGVDSASMQRWVLGLSRNLLEEHLR